MSGQLTRTLSILGIATLLTPGCLSVLNRVPEPTPDARTVCESLPGICRDKVYVVLVNGPTRYAAATWAAFATTSIPWDS